MYKINHNQDLNYLTIENTSNQLFGRIHLNDGASLQELTLDGHTIIKTLDPLTYNNTFASSILFPFANRIKDGLYTFNGEQHQFEINEEGNNNALHGLVFNKSFSIKEQATGADFASITLEYNETSTSVGFPFTYNFQVQYIFKAHSLSLHISVTNTDTSPFPFTLGWHPYFLSDNLHDSNLNFNSTKKLIIGDRCIVTGVEDISPEDVFTIENKQLDDCWILNTNKVQFNTPKYQLLITASPAENNFLQLYTPPKLNTIAIEPTTGVSDSFNNNIGLQTLQPKETHDINWTLKLI